ncbi:MAG: hypothetical protein K0R82_258 [Flavipsychrobacter sp.]|nr:hypothetical protein [Flavipsychrobacter sp.]
MKTFSAKWDNMNMLITGSVLLLTAGLIVYYFIDPQAHEKHLIAVAILLIAELFTWLSSPTKYTTDETQIIAHRRGDNLNITYSSIEKIERIYKGTLGFGIRLFGSGGLFGYLGIFTYPTTGRVNMVCTNKATMVLITTKKGKTMLSPDDPEVFIESIQHYLSKEGR